jgi:hypothetical protein
MNVPNPPGPSWNKWSIILLIVIPGTFGLIKFIEEAYHRNTQIKLAILSQKHDIRLKYLTIALQPGKSDEQSERVLRFLVSMRGDDTVLNNWAEQELKTIKKRQFIADSLQKVIESKDGKISEVKTELIVSKNKSKKQIQELNEQLLLAKQEKDDLLKKRSYLYAGEMPSNYNYSSNFTPMTFGTTFSDSTIVMEKDSNGKLIFVKKPSFLGVFK